jgi:hypothetical protein
MVFLTTVTSFLIFVIPAFSFVFLAFLFVFPAQAGIHCLALTKKSSTGGLVYG